MNSYWPGYFRRRFIEPLRERNIQSAQRHIAKLIEDGCEQGIVVTLEWAQRKEKARWEGIEFDEPAPTFISVSEQYPIQFPKRPTGSPILPSEYLRQKYIEPLKYRDAVKDLRHKDKIRSIGRAEGIEATLDWLHHKEAARREGVPFDLPSPNPRSVAETLQFRYPDKTESVRYILPVAFFYYKFIDPSFQRWRTEGYALGYAEAHLRI